MTITGSLRDTIESAVDSVIQPETPPETPAPAPAEVAPVETPAAPTAAERARDEKGRFAEEKQAKGPVNAKPPAAPVAQAPAPQTPQLPAAPKIQRPSTWKKDHWEAYDKLATENPALAQYILQRESEFAKGVSTYKQEWESAKPLLDAMAPFMPLLEQHKIAPGQWISRLGEAHRQLAMGSPEQKLSMFAKLAQDYGVPIEQMFVRGQDGQIYRNPSLQATQVAPQAQGIRQEDVQQLIKQSLAEQQSQSAIEAFAADKEKHPHFDEVRDTMAGLLQAGLAEGLDDAYEAALRHPRHAELYKAMQEQQRQQDEARQAEERRKQAEAARRKAVSPRSATPTGAAGLGEGKKALRDTISAAFDERVAGRV